MSIKLGSKKDVALACASYNPIASSNTSEYNTWQNDCVSTCGSNPGCPLVFSAKYPSSPPSSSSSSTNSLETFSNINDNLYYFIILVIIIFIIIFLIKKKLYIS